VRFVHSFVRRGSQCRQNKFLKNCTALRCYHLGGEKLAQFCANCAQLCAVITLLVIFNVLACFLISPLVNYNVLVSRGTHRRTELAAENPKNKNKF
jgi:hypothetical protein